MNTRHSAMHSSSPSQVFRPSVNAHHSIKCKRRQWKPYHYVESVIKINKECFDNISVYCSIYSFVIYLYYWLFIQMQNIYIFLIIITQNILTMSCFYLNNCAVLSTVWVKLAKFWLSKYPLGRVASRPIWHSFRYQGLNTRLDFILL